MNTKVYLLPLMFSLFLHVLLIGFPFRESNQLLIKETRQMEVSYSGNELRISQEAQKAKKFKAHSGDGTVKNNVKSLIQDRLSTSIVTALSEDVLKPENNLRPQKHVTAPPQPVDMNHKVIIPVFSTEEIRNPEYLRYIKGLSIEIKKHAYAYVYNSELELGSVYLSFVLLSNGQLKQIKIVEERTLANRELRDFAMKCIKDSSPFPPFPKDLSYPELTFRLEIAVQNKN